MKKKQIDWLLLILYLAALLYATLFRGSSGYMKNAPLGEYIRAMTNLVPFASIATYVKALFNHRMNLSTPLLNLGGNLILFMPLPYFLQRLTGCTPKQQLFTTFLAILAVEILQLLTRTGSFDIDDLILNMTGAALVCFLCE